MKARKIKQIVNKIKDDFQVSFDIHEQYLILLVDER